MSGLRAALEALADEWETTVYTLPPGYPMAVNEFCRIWFKAPIRALLAAHPPEPEASAPSDLAALLRAHEATNLVNSREHWVECGCGARLHVGEFDDPQMGYPDYDAEHNARAAHVAQVIADTYLPAVVREAEARARAGRVEQAKTTADHPEDYCHRCGGPNISWYTPGGVWDPVMRPVPGAPWKWDEIICPLCFVELVGSGGTWALLPRRLDGAHWTSADERAAIVREAAAKAWDEGATAILGYRAGDPSLLNPYRADRLDPDAARGERGAGR